MGRTSGNPGLSCLLEVLVHPSDLAKVKELAMIHSRSNFFPQLAHNMLLAGVSPGFLEGSAEVRMLDQTVECGKKVTFFGVGPIHPGLLQQTLVPSPKNFNIRVATKHFLLGTNPQLAGLIEV